jgi:hypothetical protein
MCSLIAAVLGQGSKAHTQLLQQRAQQQRPQRSSSPSEQLDLALGLTARTAAGGRAFTNSGGGSKPGAQPAPWRPSSASPHKAVAERRRHEQQLWQQWLQQAEQLRDGCGSPPSPLPPQPRACTPAAAGRVQQQPAAEAAVLVCARCGQRQSGGSGAASSTCCFHPGLVPAPGPLLFSQPWHECKSRCKPSDPGCYTRNEHFWRMPADAAGSGRSAAAVLPAGGIAAAAAAAAAGALQQRSRSASPGVRAAGAGLAAAGRSQPPRSSVAFGSSDCRSRSTSPQRTFRSDDRRLHGY